MCTWSVRACMFVLCVRASAGECCGCTHARARACCACECMFMCVPHTPRAPTHNPPLYTPTAAKVVSEAVRRKVEEREAALAAAEGAAPLSATQIARLQLQVGGSA